MIEGPPKSSGCETDLGPAQEPEKDLYLDSPVNTTLRLNLDTSNMKKGGFKLAAFGTTTSAIPNFGGATNICAKRSFYEKETVREVQGRLTKKIIDLPHDGRVQFRNLMMEVSCSVWARALLQLVYDFIDGNKEYGTLPFKIPHFRFVECALAVEQTAAGNDAAVFLVEQVIRESEQGLFRKYLNNVSPVPFAMETKVDKERAEFLAFSQHVQYWKTKRLVFVSDYQGKQIIHHWHNPH